MRLLLSFVCQTNQHVNWVNLKLHWILCKLKSIGSQDWLDFLSLSTWWHHQMETCPRYWSFVWGIHRSPVNSSHKGQLRRAFIFSLICALNKRLSKQSLGWWLETSSCALWRHCNQRSLIIPWATRNARPLHVSVLRKALWCLICRYLLL